MLMPKKVKRRKVFSGRNKGKATRGNKIAYGEYALVALEHCELTSNQIEAARRAATRYTKRGGKIWINVFPNKPITRKAIGQRMGKGKGAVEGWVAPVLPGRILFEISGCSEAVAKEAMSRAANKLCVRCKFLARQA